MIRITEIEHHVALEDYAGVAQLAHAVAELRAEAERMLSALRGRTIWMVNSTAQGGGVAEMLPSMISLLRELGFTVEWAVMQTAHAEFFQLTKRIHNLIHDSGDAALGSAERELYDAVSRENAAALKALVRPRDVLVVHDPQPLGAGALVKREAGIPAIWRCHIGLDQHTPATSAAWRFLEPHASQYDRAVFTLPEYIPSYLAGRAHVIHPAIDPLGHKNRELSLHKLVGILCDSSLVPAYGPLLSPPFDDAALRLRSDGTWTPAATGEEIGLLYRPIVCQISRWDRLKGFAPLLTAFHELKRKFAATTGTRDERHQRAVEIARLVLAGPAPSGVADDPEAVEVLDELTLDWLALDPRFQRDIAILQLPMTSLKQNALMVNALQRSSTIAVQNSIREGFGLTATEAMWKRVPVVGTSACGLRAQIRDGLDGRIVADAEDPQGIAAVLDELLGDEPGRDRMGERAQRRAQDEFLVFSQLRRWMELLVDVAC